MRIENAGPVVLRTDYWATPHAARGYVYLSANAGTVRLLIPPAALPILAEVPPVGTPATLQREHGRYVLAWEDGNPEGPYVLEIDERQADRRIPASDRGRKIPLVWYVRAEAVSAREARREEVTLR